MKAFQYVSARSTQEAVTLLGDDYAKTKILAGGLDLLGEMKLHLLEPETVVSIQGLDELRLLQNTGGTLKIGALVTLAEIAADATIRAKYTALADAAEVVGSPQIRNVGTLGGNLCQRPRCWYYRDEAYRCFKKGGTMCYSIVGKNRYHAILGGGPCFMVHPSDCAPALAALGATVQLLGPDGSRVVPIEDFFISPSQSLVRENVVKPKEMLVAVEIPERNRQSAYIKFREKEGFDWALSAVALALEFDGLKCAKANLVLGGVAPIPWRVKKAETLLVGNPITEEIAKAVGEAAVESAMALSENSGKIPLTKALVKEAILKLTPTSTAVHDSRLY